ncbi:LysR family transcriptional regulator [Arthrobacter sp. V4I6]|uniref:LysR family transcriptional regulator n=1 Tax=unclassified Arthrobacter TaxID=235627 RepID=UPI0035936F2B
MELRWMRTFVAGGTELNYGRAAIVPHVSQPAVSQQIRQLEREVGVPLFERTSRSVRLTAAGEAFLPHCEQTLADADAATSPWARRCPSARGNLRTTHRVLKRRWTR